MNPRKPQIGFLPTFMSFVLTFNFLFFFSQMFLLITFFWFHSLTWIDLRGTPMSNNNLLKLLLPENLLLIFIQKKINCYKYWIHNNNDNKMIIISIIITAHYSTILKRKFQTTASSITILNILLCKIQWIHQVLFLKQVPVSSWNWTWCKRYIVWNLRGLGCLGF